MSLNVGHVLRRSLLLMAICGLFALCYAGINVDVESEKAFCDEKSPIPGEPTKTSGDLSMNQTLDNLNGNKTECVWLVGNDSSNFTVHLYLKALTLSPNDSLILVSRKSDKTIIQLNGSQTAGIVLTSEKNITIRLMLSNDTFVRTFAVRYSYANNVEQIVNIEEPGRFFFIYSDINKTPAFPKFDLTFAAAPNPGGSKLLIDFEKFDIKGAKGFVDFDKAENVANTTQFKAQTAPTFILSSPVNVNFDLENIENGTELRINYEVVTALCSNYSIILSNLIDKNVSTSVRLPKDNELQSLPSFKCFNVYNIVTDANQVAFANVLLTDFQFQNAFDSLLILDGDSRNSTVIASILPQYLPNYQQRFLYSTSPKLWVMYNSPVVINKMKSIYNINIEARSLGGIVPNSDAKGTDIKVVKDSKTELFPIVFVYEVQEGMQAVLSMADNNQLPKASDIYMSVYNSIARNGNPAIIKLMSQTDPPDFVASDTNQIRVEIESVGEDFKAKLIAVKKGCHSTANLVTYLTDSYSISGDCNEVCSWLIPSRIGSNGQFVLKLSQLNLPEKTDSIILEKFLNTTSTVFVLNGTLSMAAFPDMILDSSFSYTLFTRRQKCEKINSSVSLSGSVTFVNQTINSQTINVTASGNTSISSINYPNYYPLGNDLIWKFYGTHNQSVLMTFIDLQLASKHQLIIKDQNRSEVIYDRNTTTLPSDYIAMFPSFMNFKTNVVESAPFSGRGFSLNLTLVECGGYIELEPNIVSVVGINNTAGVSKCIWIVTVPNQKKDNVTLLEFNVTATEPSGELVIYDSSSIRDSNHIMNMTYFTVAKTVPKSSTNTLVIIYTKRDAKTSLTPISFNFTSKDCNYSLCDNLKRCMIKEFWCNGINDCGDWSDERFCNGSQPQPPPPTPEPQPSSQSHGGVNGWVVLFVICPLSVGLGVIGTLYGPTFMRRFRRGRYTEFQDFSEVS